ncbi:MAG: hypothetical protein C9355_00795 [Thalassolituus maritimus]|uniref:Uncharacterized protein n=1 Tax=Thalassolituus maritimus TaxID=484498 RepID=A0A1N7PBU7_9GAMM|nr:hypothetical protein [Thalassolituus maritimus]TPD55924.1 MAG: hypothetical protein C9355_00795 [Thalassolituus maritimus]SIT08105.1 hypothetical protein SAMN05421686_10980 [Thalassolituus maritimus]
MPISLKAQNVVPLTVLVLLQVYLVLCLAQGALDLGGIISSMESASLMLLLNVVIVWLSYLVPADIKNGMVFFRVRNALPGHRFLSLMKSDPRIDVARIHAIHDLSSLVSDESAQNSFWYQVFYKPNTARMEIKSAHKSYLLYRDACAVSLILCGVYCLVSWLSPAYLGGSDSLYGLVFIVFALGFALSANNTGKRMVTTAIALSTAKAGTDE